jgi:hypothetical protein
MSYEKYVGRGRDNGKVILKTAGRINYKWNIFIASIFVSLCSIDVLLTRQTKKSIRTGRL